MTQIFRIEIDGIDVTDNAENTSISRTINRLYSVASFSYSTDNAQSLIDKDVSIFCGDYTFNGFVFSVNKESKLMHRVECRTHSARLTEPFCQNMKKTENATTALELCALYEADTGIQITYLSEDIDFGGSYERDGTILTALTAIANITGSEFYEDGTGVTIEPNKAVSGNGRALNGDEYFKFAQTSLSIMNRGVGIINIQNGELESNAVLSKNIINVDVDEEYGDVYVFCNPKGTLDSYSGCIIDSTISSFTVEEKRELSNKTHVVLKGAISSVNSVKLNGSKITNYNFSDGYNVLYFTTEMSGFVTISYNAYVQFGKAVTSKTPMGNFFDVYMSYLDQELSMQGFINRRSTTNTDGDMIVVIDDEMNPAKGFDVFVHGGEPKIDILFNGSRYPKSFNSSPYNYTKTENLNLSPVSGGEYEARPQLPADLLTYATSYGSSIPFTETVDHYFRFTKYYPKAKGTYSLAMNKFYIKTPIVANSDGLMLVTNKKTGEVFEYDLILPNENDLSTLPCELNQNVGIDIATRCDVNIDKCAGVTLVVTNPDDTVSYKTVQNDGFIKIFVTLNGDYVVDTAPITGRNTSETLTVDVPVI